MKNTTKPKLYLLALEEKTLLENIYFNLFMDEKIITHPERLND